MSERELANLPHRRIPSHSCRYVTLKEREHNSPFQNVNCTQRLPSKEYSVRRGKSNFTDIYDFNQVIKVNFDSEKSC